MAVNKLIATNLAAIATFENERRKERQRQGILLWIIVIGKAL
jgi:DNA invertase Pin-like site-specific DNA recombinase